MKHFLIFAGTTEGRILTDYLLKQHHMLSVCTATEYGTQVIPPNPMLTLHAGRMDFDDMIAFMQQQPFDAVFDATHPYAVIASDTIEKACAYTGLPYYRILREESDTPEECGKIHYTASMTEAIAFLAHTSGNILLTTGSKELSLITALPDYADRVYARILSTPDMVAHAVSLGIKGRHLICMQGPFSEELNTALIHEFDIAYMVTKSSGKAGGFDEKISSAKKTDTTLIIIGRPPQKDGYYLSDIFRMNF